MPHTHVAVATTAAPASALAATPPRDTPPQHRLDCCDFVFCRSRHTATAIATVANAVAEPRPMLTTLPPQYTPAIRRGNTVLIVAASSSRWRHTATAPVANAIHAAADTPAPTLTAIPIIPRLGAAQHDPPPPCCLTPPLLLKPSNISNTLDGIALEGRTMGRPQQNTPPEHRRLEIIATSSCRRRRRLLLPPISSPPCRGAPSASPTRLPPACGWSRAQTPRRCR